MDNMNDNRNLEEQNNVEKSSSNDNATGNNVDNGNKKSIAKWIGKFHLSSRKKILIVYFTIVVAYICILHFVPFDMNGFLDSTKDKNNYNENVDKPSDTDNKDNNEQDNNEDEDTSSTGLTIYKNDKSVFFTVPTESKDAEILDKVTDDTHGYVLYKDNNKIKLYSYSEDSIKVLNDVDNSYDCYSLTEKVVRFNGRKERFVIGINYYNYLKDIGYEDSSSCKYYDLIQEKHRFNGYCVDSFVQSGDYITSSDYIIAYKNLRHEDLTFVDNYIINIKNENVVLKIENDNVDSEFAFNEGFFIHSLYHGFTVYTINGEKVFYTNNDKLFGEYSNNLYYNDNNEILKYDINGKAINKKSINYKILLISRNYAFAMENNKIIAINLDDFSECNLGTYDDINDDYFLNGYYVDYFDNYKYGEGYYLYFGGFTIYFNPDTEKVITENK